jgi:hypothetical protein
MAGDRRVQVAFHVDRRIYFPFKALAQAHRMSVEGAVEALMAEALERAGLPPAQTDEHAAATREAAVKVE